MTLLEGSAGKNSDVCEGFSQRLRGPYQGAACDKPVILRQKLAHKTT
jgi:hypothetical protein